MPSSARNSIGRRSSSLGRPRQNSVFSLDLQLLDENTNEMYSGAHSEAIPSSISSFHYAHSLARDRDLETSPLLERDLDLRPIVSGASTDAANFRFFTVNEIESAPGGLTLENPEDPVDYNTNWDFPTERYDDELQPFHSRSSSLRPSLRPLGLLVWPVSNDSAESVRSNYDTRYRRRSSHSSGSDRSSVHLGLDGGLLAEQTFLHDYTPTTCYQRYYLAEEDIVVGIAGYVSCTWKSALYYLLCVVTGGLAYLVLRWLPRQRINLMGTLCPLGKAEWCVIENVYGELAIVPVTKARLAERLLSFLNVGPEDSDDVDLPSKEANPVVPYVHFFEYRYLKFFYNPVEDLFKTNSNWFDPYWLSVRNARDGLSQSLHEQRHMVFGENNIRLREKLNVQLLADEVLHPFYVFQVFSIFLWLADDYYYYALCIFIISLFSIVNSLLETKATIARLQTMSVFSCDVRVWRNGFWTHTTSDDLVPGDVFEVEPSLSIVPCDALLINGECVVNESMLTGESVPVTKTQATNDTVQYLADDFTSSALARSLLYNGTRLLKMKTPNDEPVMAMVLKTGFSTTKGSLIRSMLFPKPVGFKFYEDSFKYIGFMTGIAFLGFIYSTYNFIQLGISKRIMILRALDIITIVVPPALPATLTIGTSFAVGRLQKKQIFCIAPTRINIGGKIDVACFDKTGTLTEDGLDILGVHCTKNAQGRKEIIFGDLLPLVEDLNKASEKAFAHDTQSNTSLLGCMATCHSLKSLDDTLLGDPLDVKMFEFTKYHYAEEFGGYSVPLIYHTIGKEADGFKLLKEFEFISGLRRMSVIAETGQNYTVFTKGAPEVMVDICDPQTLPSNFEELLHKYTHGGYRVIACASKELPSNTDVRSLDRDSVESGLEFSGFIIFENKLKPSTKPTLQALRRAEIRTVMCTGDNVLTAVSVGRECHLIDPLVTQVFIPRFAADDEQLATGGTGLIWEDMHHPENRLDPLTLKRQVRDIRDDVQEYVLAITGDVFRYLLVELQLPDLRDLVLMKCNVFARMSPDEKHELVEQLQKLDYTVGFCGDGANDCGALKAADVGILLSEAEASVAAPFTSRVFEISCVLDVIKEGRLSLVTSFSCFKYMSLYSAIQFVTVTILYQRGTNLGDFQFLYIDLFLILPLAIFMSWSKPFDHVVVKRPTANLVSPKVLIPLLCHIVVILVFQVLLWFFVQRQPWYIRPQPSNDDDDVKSSDNTMLFLFSNFQYILNAVVLSSGPPYRAPMHENKPFLVNLVLAVLLSTVIFRVDQYSWWGDFMQLTNMDRRAYMVVLVGALANFALANYGEKRWFRSVAQLYKSIVHRHRRSKKRFKNLRQRGHSHYV